MKHIPEPGEHHLERCRAVLHAAGPGVQAAHQRQEPEQRAQREHVNNARALEFCAGNPAHQRQREHHPAQRRPHRVRELEDGPAPGDGVHKMFFRHQVRNKRGACRRGEGSSRPDEKQDSIDGQHAGYARPREGEQRAGANDLQAVANQDDPAAVEPVGRMPGRQKKEKSGKKQRQPRVAQVERAVGDGIHLPRHGDRLRLRAQNDRDAGKLVAPEITGSKRLQTAPRRLLREGRSHLVQG